MLPEDHSRGAAQLLASKTIRCPALIRLPMRRPDGIAAAHGLAATATEANAPRRHRSERASCDMAAAVLALAIEAEWRKRAEGVIPAQPKARPEGQRPILPHP